MLLKGAIPDPLAIMMIGFPDDKGLSKAIDGLDKNSYN